MQGIPFESATDRPNEQFVQIHNDRVRNVGPVKLSGIAMALHHYLLSLPPGWTTTIDRIAEDAFPLDSRERLRRANRELMNAGYVILRTERASSGRFIKRYQTFHTARPVDERTPSAGRSTRRKPAQDDDANVASSQVAPDAGFPAAGFPAAGKPAAGFAADIRRLTTKTDEEDQGKNTYAVAPEARPVAGGPAMVSRRARGSAASARVFSDSEIVDETRFAIAAAYGESWNKTITDDEVIALVRFKGPNSQRFTSVQKYMQRIFNNTPAFETLLAQLDAHLDPANSDDFGQAHDVHPTCPRCDGTTAELDPNRGICAWCCREVSIAGGADDPDGWNVSILSAVKTALYVATSRSVDDEWAAKVADHILSGKNVKNPANYVTSVITSEDHGSPMRFLPTPVPARVA